jgi:hypothetical protein
MSRHPLIALASAALLCAALPVQAQSSSLTTFHKAYASTQHCCWDAPFNYQWLQGEAPSYEAVSWSSSARVSGTLDFGLITGQASGAADVTGYVYVDAVGEARDYWVDTFTVMSDTLAAGTPVSLKLGVTLDAAIRTSAYGQGVALAVIGTGLDAGWITGVDTRAVGAGHREVVASFSTYVGGSVTLVGQLLSRAWSSASNGAGAGEASTDAVARFTVEATTPGAFYRTASGHDYAMPVSTVPEPSVWWLLVAGAVTGLCLRGRGRAPAQPGSTAAALRASLCCSLRSGSTDNSPPAGAQTSVALFPT